MVNYVHHTWQGRIRGFLVVVRRGAHVQNCVFLDTKDTFSPQHEVAKIPQLASQVSTFSLLFRSVVKKENGLLIIFLSIHEKRA